MLARLGLAERVAGFSGLAGGRDFLFDGDAGGGGGGMFDNAEHRVTGDADDGAAEATAVEIFGGAGEGAGEPVYVERLSVIVCTGTETRFGSSRTSLDGRETRSPLAAALRLTVEE